MSFGIVVVTLLALPPRSLKGVGEPHGRAAVKALPPPVQLTAEQDHQRMMNLLGIKSLRPGADPHKPNSPDAPNYDESKANPYPDLPNPLVLNDGRKVTSAAMWWKLRRPEIVKAFDEDIYGKVPRHTPKVNWKVASLARGINGGVPFITKHLVGEVDNSSYPLITVNIELTLTTPANAPGLVPVMIHFGFSPAFFAAFRARLAARGIKLPPPPPGPTWQQQLLEKGWGYAVLVPTSYQADNGAGLTEGIIGLCNKGQPRKPGDWGALRAWAWGASRALDYLETDKAVNAHEVGIEGVSRYGKAALVTMAYDRRFAIGLIGSSGKGGATLYRRNFGERNGNLAGAGEYHWMAENFLKYDGPLTANDLPVDSHELIALCAPRPVFISYGNPKIEGGWVDMKGAFMAAVAAGPVYRLLGRRGLEAAQLPPMGTALISGDIAFREHHGGHTDVPNWSAFIEFASHYFKAPEASGRARVR
ncbi:MAG: acetylxylan esterase [Acidobacteriota bacterium]|nr:acetylxylan esterase [Acidobacteriota bacterium]